MYYNVALLNPKPGADNSAVFDGGQVYGIEVTVPALAKRCEDNLDPQHGPDGKPTVAACQAALTWPLPPKGTTLVTIRPDADALMAMAVLELRAQAGDLAVAAPTFASELPACPYERVIEIALADCERGGPWPGPGQVSTGQVTIAGQLTQTFMTPGFPPVRMLEIAFGWLYQSVRAREMLQAAERIREMLARLQAGVSVQTQNGLAVVIVTDPEVPAKAISHGYRYAPVVVMSNPSHCWPSGQVALKHTVARWNSSYSMGWDGMIAELQTLEPGWGGSASICGSPQGAASQLSTEDVVAVVRRHMDS